MAPNAQDEVDETGAVALEEFEIEGVCTNLPFLRAIAAHPDFQSNSFDTHWLERELMPVFNQRKDS